MSTKPNTNLNAIELTQAELDSVAGGGMASAQAAMGAQSQAAQAQANQVHAAHAALLRASLNNAIKKAGSSLKAGI